VPASGSDPVEIVHCAELFQAVTEHLTEGRVGVRDASVRVHHHIAVPAPFEDLAVTSLTLPQAFRGADSVQCVGEIVGHLLEEPLLLLVVLVGPGYGHA
jgi:hypothetical protein